MAVICCGGWESNLGLLEEHRVLLSAESLCVSLCVGQRKTYGSSSSITWLLGIECRLPGLAISSVYSLEHITRPYYYYYYNIKYNYYYYNLTLLLLFIF